MKIIVAPNSLKRSLGATKVAQEIKAGLEEGYKGIEVITQPIADGGEMTSDILLEALGGTMKITDVTDPLNRKIEARYGILNDGKTGVIEVAAASGMALLDPDEMNPMRASTYGTGQLMLKLLDEGCTRIIIGLGGSATVDAGTGILKALGVRLEDRNGSAIPVGGGYLKTIDRVDVSRIDSRLKKCRIDVMCDVDNPLLGLNGAAYVFGPQKGATREQVRLLEENIEHYNQATIKAIDNDLSTMKHGGAAGGIAATLNAYLGGTLHNGINYLMDVVKMDQLMEGADLVITAEGRLDEQTLSGKGPYGVANLAKSKGIKVACITGQLGENVSGDDFPFFDVILTLPNRPMSLEESIKHTPELLRFTAYQLARAIEIGVVGK